eukprot:TRINITY_DN2730_c0_g1_i1.p2 TRINITY_DN2730_c0_g1~~TRINITY_DN2730_c0_g1_i1.p2  ORF type:complete len:125 (+),score=17.22 TRINITY_DN2730_c0_g1_i1:1-375(+)
MLLMMMMMMMMVKLSGGNSMFCVLRSSSVRAEKWTTEIVTTVRNGSHSKVLSGKTKNAAKKRIRTTGSGAIKAHPSHLGGKPKIISTNKLVGGQLHVPSLLKHRNRVDSLVKAPRPDNRQWVEE